MKKIKLILKITALALIFVACEKEEDYYAITYFDVVGEGYVFMYDTNNSTSYPVQGAEINVVTRLEIGSGLFGGNSPEPGIYTTDATGKYKIHFIKRTHKSNAEWYRVYVKYPYTKDFRIDVEEVKKAKHTLKLDTVKYEK